MSANLKAIEQPSAEVIEQVVIKGDLAQLTAQAKAIYYKTVADSLGLNYLTKPFSYIKLNGELQLYVNRSATDQLRKSHNVSIKIVSREIIGDLYIVTAQAWLPDGRIDESTGVVDIKGKAGDFLANLMIKAESKSKRRVTLSIIGLGWLSSDEAESIPGAELIEEKPIKPAINYQEWKCSPELVETLIVTARDAKAAGVNREELLAIMPQGVTQMKQLSNDQVTEYLGKVSELIQVAVEAKAEGRE